MANTKNVKNVNVVKNAKSAKNAQKDILLNGTWRLHDEPSHVGADQAGRILSLAEGWIDQPVPGDIRQGALAAGWIQEPLVSNNSFDQVWIEERSWWFKRTFTLTADDLAHPYAELELHGLDCKASVFLNGVHLGEHPSAFRPFEARVREHLREGENTLLIRLTHGLDGITPDMYEPLLGYQPTEECRNRPERGDRRRVFARKPQYVWGWDWQPRVATVCINGDCMLRLMKSVTIRDVQVQAWPAKDAAELDVAVAVHWLDVYKSGRGVVRVRVLSAEGKLVASDELDTLLQSGVNTIDFTLTVKNPRLWWPNGMGEPYRYTVEADVVCGPEKVSYKPIQYGIRWIELLTEGEFTFLVNGERVYAKGGNWVPADSLYARVTDEKYRALVSEAAGANFNMFRIWGGGLYEREAFYDACDEFGVMIWHDFMLACSPYPDHLEWFRDEMAKEADFQTRRLRNHACMALWCGQNEWLYCVGAAHVGTLTDKGSRLLGEVLPAAVRRNCPTTPYWYTSPSGGDKPDSSEVGDCHFWAVPADRDFHRRFDPTRFDGCDSLFVSEYGYQGPLCLESTLEYLQGAPYEPTRPHESVWENHFGTFDGGGVQVGLKRHYVDPVQTSLEEYLYFGGLLQGLMYGYSLEALRAKGSCGGSLIWMYNDAWPEVGWTVIDYYLRRKMSYWFVKRAYAPVRLIVRADGGKVNVTCVNDTLGAVKATVEFGYLPSDGSPGKLRSKQIAVGATERKVVATFPQGEHDAARGVWVARFVDERGATRGEGVSPSRPALGVTLPSAMLWTTEHRNRPAIKPTLTLTVKPLSTNTKKGPAKNAGGEDYVLTVSSDTLAHAVELLLPAGAEPSDNYFDLTPGETRRIVVRSKTKLTDQNVTLRSAYDWFVNRPEAIKE